MTSYTWPCISGTLYQVTCPVYGCTAATLDKSLFFTRYQNYTAMLLFICSFGCQGEVNSGEWTGPDNLSHFPSNNWPLTIVGQLVCLASSLMGFSRSSQTLLHMGNLRNIFFLIIIYDLHISSYLIELNWRRRQIHVVFFWFAEFHNKLAKNISEIIAIRWFYVIFEKKNRIPHLPSLKMMDF